MEGRAQDGAPRSGLLRSSECERPSMQVLRTALCPPHRYLSSSERETVLNTALNAFQSVDFSEGDLLFREGDPGVSFILIREGEVIAIECL